MAGTNAVNHFLDLDLYEYTSYPVVKAQQGDSNRYLTCRLNDHEEVYTIPTDGSVTVTLEGERPTGTSFSISGVISNDGLMVTFNITQAITQFGDVKAQVRLYDNVSNPSTVLSSIPLFIEVEENYAGTPSEEDETIIRQLQRELYEHIGNIIIHRAIVYSSTEPEHMRDGDIWLREYT